MTNQCDMLHMTNHINIFESGLPWESQAQGTTGKKVVKPTNLLVSTVAALKRLITLFALESRLLLYQGGFEGSQTKLHFLL